MILPTLPPIFISHPTFFPIWCLLITPKNHPWIAHFFARMLWRLGFFTKILRYLSILVHIITLFLWFFLFYLYFSIIFVIFCRYYALGLIFLVLRNYHDVMVFLKRAMLRNFLLFFKSVIVAFFWDALIPLAIFSFPRAQTILFHLTWD